MRRSVKKMHFGIFSVILLLAFGASQEAFARRRCSADCDFGGGSIKCSRGSTASCGCTSIGTFEGSCSLASRIAGGSSASLRLAPAASSDLEISLITAEQIQNLHAVSKALRARGKQHERVATALDALAASRTSKEVGAAQERLATIIARSSNETRTLLASLMADLP